MPRKTFKGKLGRVLPNADISAEPIDEAASVENRTALKGDIYEGTRRLPGARDIPLERIRPDSDQPRKSYSRDRIKELSNTILEVGVINPIQVRYIASDDIFQIISGERRYRASEMAGLKSIPCIVRETGDEERRAHQIIENVHREDFNPIDRARALLELKQTLGVKTKWKKVEEMTGIGERRRQQFLILLDLPHHMQEAILYQKTTAWGGTITEKHARALVVLREDPEAQESLYQKILSSNEPYSGDRAISRARNIKTRTEPQSRMTFKYSNKNDLIKQLKAKLADLAGDKRNA